LFSRRSGMNESKENVFSGHDESDKGKGPVALNSR
jgi:hypothetical protein